MNLSGVFNLTELARSQNTGQTQASQNSGSSSTPSVEEPNGGKTDQANLSASGLAAAQSVASDGSTSDVRMEKVVNVRAAIQSGNYHVSSLDVADKMMQDMFDPRL